MKRYKTGCLLIVLASATLSCGGGDAPSALTPGPSGSFTISFTPDAPSPPGSNTVSLSQAPGGGGDLITVNVGVTGVNDVFGASFRIAYDPAMVTFENWSAGSFLEGSGNLVVYQAFIVTPGVVEIGASCAACPSGENAASTETLAQLIFRALNGGNSALTFVAADLLDSSSPPTTIGGLTWFGGTVVAE